MLKLEIRKARARVTTRFWGQGSVLAETINTRCQAIETILEIESDEEEAEIAKLARVAEQGCYVIQTLHKPTPVSYEVRLNGRKLDPELK